MTRKAPSGPKHDRCIDHAEHPYPAKGMLCIGAVVGREGMIAFADELAVSAAQHRAAFLARPWPQPSAKARKPVRPLLPLASPLNDGLVDHRCPATAEHGNRIRASFLIPGSRGRYGVCVSCGWDAPERPYIAGPAGASFGPLIGPFVAEMERRPELPAAAFAPRSTADGVSLAELHARFMAQRGRPVEAPAPVKVARKARAPRVVAEPIVEAPAPVLEPIGDAPEPGTWTTTPEGIPVYAPEPVSVEPAAEPSRCWQYLHTTGGTRRCTIQPDLHDGPHDYESTITPIGPAPDTYAAAVELAETRPDPCPRCRHSAHGATCLPCDDAAQVGVYAPCQVTQPDAEPSGGAEGEPEPVLSAPAPVSAPAERPTCPRCGQSFRVKGTGRDWHVVNRPDCARVAVAV